MVHLNLSYDYVAAFFEFMLLMWYVTEKKVPLKSYRYFGGVLTAALLATIFEIITFTMVRYPDRIPFNVVYTIMSWQMLFIHGFVICLTFCMLSMTHIKVRKYPLLKYIFILSLATVCVVCILNPGLEWAAVLENGEYRAVGAGYLLYVVDTIMVLLIAWMLIVRKKDFKFLKPSLVFLVFVCGVISAVAQLFGFAPMLNLAITIFCLVMYLFQQSPDAVTDKVTEQFTRAFLGEYMQDRFATDRNFSVIIVDMDDFKFINQNYGLTVGDVLLYQVGKYLEGMKPAHKVFHLDADRFGIVVERNKISPEQVAKDIRNRFMKPWCQNKVEINVSTTICMINCPEDANSAEELLEIIDYAMDRAKKVNKGRIVHSSELELEKIQISKNIEKVVKEAIATENILVYYQPIFSVEKQCYASAEALVRLYDEQMGWIPPDVFIPIAEKGGFIIELGEIILHKVCNFIKQNKLLETTIEYIDINVSSLQLMQKGFALKMLDILKQYDVLVSQINVEITETAMMTSFSVVNENLTELVKNHVAISLDDYGSGYATINYINRLPFKYIKVDKEIVQASIKEEKANVTLEHTIGMLKALEMIIVAEGVETKEMQEKLVHYGCQYLQGWFYSKALPEGEFIEFVKG